MSLFDITRFSCIFAYKKEGNYENGKIPIGESV